MLFYFSNYLPLQIWTLKICNHDISKSITARSFKLGQLIEDDEYIFVSPLQGSGDILFFPLRPCVCMSACLSVHHKMVSAL